jgi:diguanylate cyclase (GGDEF)-like protein/PAS domain S-box-containing protein
MQAGSFTIALLFSPGEKRDFLTHLLEEDGYAYTLLNEDPQNWGQGDYVIDLLIVEESFAHSHHESLIHLKQNDPLTFLPALVISEGDTDPSLILELGYDDVVELTSESTLLKARLQTLLRIRWQTRALGSMLDKEKHFKIISKLSVLGQQLSIASTSHESALNILSAADDLIGWDACLVQYYSVRDNLLYTIVRIDEIDGKRTEIPSSKAGEKLSETYRDWMKQDARLILRDENDFKVEDKALETFGDTARRSASLIYVPVRHKDQNIGVISIQSYTFNAYTKEDLKVMQILSDNFSGALERTFAEEMLKQREEHLSLLTQQIPFMLWTTDEDLRFTLTEGLGFKAFRINPDMLLGKPIHELFKTSAMPEMPSMLHNNALEGNTGQIELAWMGREFDLSVQPLRDEDGKITGCIGVAIDVTQRAMAKRALKESEANLKAIFNNSLQSFLLVDRTFKLLSFNRRAYDEFRQIWSTDLWVGASMLNVLPPRHRDGFLRHMGAAIQGESVTLEIQLGLEETDNYWFEINFQPVATRIDEPAGVCISALNITARKKSAEALLRSEGRFRSLVQNSTDVFGIIAHDRTILYQSPSCKQVLGYDPEELTGRSIIDFIHPEDKGLVNSTLDRFRSGALSDVTVEFRFLHSDGRWLHLESVGRDLSDDSSIRGIVTNTRDITDRLQAVRALRQSEERFRQFAENTFQIFYILSPDFSELYYVNPAFEEITGYALETIYRRPMSIIKAILPLDRSRIIRSFASWFGSKPDTELREEFRILHVNGSTHWVENRSFPVHDDNGEIYLICGIAEENTERILTLEAMRESEERYALAVRGANDGIWDWNLGSDTVYYSPRWKQILGIDASGIKPSIEEWYCRVHPDDFKHLKEDINKHLNDETPHFENEHRIKHSGGDYIWVLSRGLAIRDAEGRPTRIAGSLTDVTKRKKVETQLLHDAFHDSLIGLPNRALFMDHLNLAMAHASRRKDYTFAVLFFDIDRFKVINDSLGHFIGDKLLIATAERLEKCLRPGDTVARMGGDEFAILLDDVEIESTITQVADRIHNSLSQSFNIDSNEIYITASIGIAIGSANYEKPEFLLRDADLAMYRAKGQGRGRTELFDQSMYISAMETLNMETDMRRALARGEFVLYYQPIINVMEGSLAGFEALVRWRHPERGLLLPDDFLWLAEESGLITPIGWWAIEEACRQMQIWQNEIPDSNPLTVSVNLHGKLYSQPTLVERVRRVLNEFHVDGHRLNLEITEQDIMEQAEVTNRTLLDLKQLNVNLHIDDFGTG